MDMTVPNSKTAALRSSVVRVPSPGETVLEQYRLLHELDSGSFSNVYMAQKVPTGEQVVAKIPLEHLMSDQDETAVRHRFAAELQAATLVSHDNLAAFHAAGDTDDGVPVLIMEYVAGSVLADVLTAEAPLSLPSVARLGLQLGAALEAVHAAGIIHCDVTPRNIMVARDNNGSDRFVLLDFGAAAILGMPRPSLGPVGTPRYMPREQICARAVPESDMFALGAILWWALTGEEYLSDLADVRSVLLHQVDMREPPDPRQIRSSVPMLMADAVMRLLHPEATRRPSAGQFLETWSIIAEPWADAAPRSRVRMVSSALDTASQLVEPEVTTTVEVDDDITEGLNSLQSGPVGTEAESRSVTDTMLDVGIEAYMASESGAGPTLVDLDSGLDSALDSVLDSGLDNGLASGPDTAGRRELYLDTTGRGAADDEPVARGSNSFAEQFSLMSNLAARAGATPVSIPAGKQSEVARFLRLVPSWIEDIAAARARGDRASVARLSRQVSQHAYEYGMADIGEYAELLAARADNRAAPLGADLVEQLEALMRPLFRERVGSPYGRGRI